MAGHLTDDGTMDTVIKCDICGEETRYSYQIDGGDDTYDEWVRGCIADFDRDHMCPVENEDDDNDVIDEETGWGQDTGDDDDEYPTRDTGSYRNGYRTFRNGTEREDFGSDR